MLGFYNITVVLTYISLLVSSAGIAAAVRGRAWPALICLAISGFLDLWDGKVARLFDRKNARSEEEQRFGMQIDSLCDLICFGVLPAVICFTLWHSRRVLNGKGIWPMAILCGFFILASLIRLAYFNVTEELHTEQSGKKREYFEGLPTTAAALIFPLVYAICMLWAPRALPWAYAAALLITGLLFLMKKIKIKKVNSKGEIIILALIGGVIFGLLIASRAAG